jgi:diguanylate cyclase (GGDEF)-like protein
MLGLVTEPHIFARVGGEEFAVLCFGDLTQATTMAEQVRRAIADLSIEYDGKKIPVTASLGVVQYGPHLDASGMYDLADERLYAAKKAGRNQVCAR